MTKQRKICIGDIVKYHSYDWVVKRKRNNMANLVRRQVCCGPPIWVPISRLKHADSSWRSALRANDPIKLFLGGCWVKARVVRREGNNLCIQPSFTNMVVRHKDSSGHIALCSHNHPLWKEEVSRLVMFRGEVHMERGHGLMFPWTYGEGVPVRQRQHIFITKVQLPVFHTGGIPMKMYNDLSTDEIMHDLRFHMHYRNYDMPELLKKLAIQYVDHSLARYNYQDSRDSLDLFAAIALDNNDLPRVSQLMSVGRHNSDWQLAEYAMCMHHSRPYFVPKITYNHELRVLDIDIYWTGICTKINPSLKKIFELISTPLKYQPAIMEVHGSPEISYALSRMLGMETEPLEKLYLRSVGNQWLMLSKGFCIKKFSTFGGVVQISGIDYVSLVRELVKRNPLKTLVIVEKDTLPMWKEFSIWHGRKRENGQVVVTTRLTLLRSWTSLNGFQRLICLSVPSAGTVYSDAIAGMQCKVRWVFGQATPTAFNVLGLPFNPEACVVMSRYSLEKMGVLFPIKTFQKIVCKPKHDSQDIISNIACLPDKKRKEMLSKFLLKPSLVPPHVRGEKLDTYNGTIASIAEKFKVDTEILDARTKETCAVCLEHIKDPAVTPCGHVFCAGCAAELDKRNICCAMCRSKINGFMRVSDENTPGKIVMHGGSCYRVQDDDTWGTKYSILKEHSEATFVTEYPSVKKVLKKAFPKTEVVTRKAIDNGLRVNTSKVVMLEPSQVPSFDYAWGQDLEIIQLCYTVKV